MANIKCYSGGKLIKTFKNIKQDDIEFSDSGFTITDEGQDIIDWRGDFLIEW